MARDRDLNAVYNYSQINLNMHPYVTMHQRLSECGLAGGFMMVADIPAGHDGSPVRRYFEPDREIVLFETTDELVDRCRYYLAHEEERGRIAEQMHERARRERTVAAGAQETLGRWRKLLLSNG